MSNIHVLPTDKPSRLWLSTRRKNHLIFDKFPRVGVEYVEPQHIYITSDEEVNKTDYVIVSCSEAEIEEVNLVTEYYNEQFLFDDRTQIHMDYCRKIILTTDQSLDGVQPIPDEFLEWFVKNPSCEYVEVKHFGTCCGNQLIAQCINCNQYNPVYKIILKEESKQETLEEAADNYSKELTQVVAFYQGAKWQAERMYSEEDLRTAYNISKNANNFKEWFKNFKKK